MSSLECLKYFEQKLSSLRRLYNRTDLMVGFYYWLSAAIGLLIISGGIEALATMEPAGRWMTLISVITLLGLACFYLLGLPFLRMINVFPSYPDTYLAEQVGRRFPEIRDKLRNVLELFRSGAAESPYYSRALTDAAIFSVYKQAMPLDFSLAADRNKIRRAFRRNRYIYAGLAAIFILFHSSYIDAYRRLVYPNERFAPPAPFSITAEPGHGTVLHGETVKLRFQMTRLGSHDWPYPDKISVFTQSADGDYYKEETARHDSAGMYPFTLAHVRQPVRYYAEASSRIFGQAYRIRSEEYRIDVVKRPALKRLLVELEYPSYANMEPVALDENNGEIAGLRGTWVKIKIESTKPLHAARLYFTDSTMVPLSVSRVAPHKAEGAFRLKQSGAYHIDLTDTEGIPSAEPVEYAITVIPDAYPFIQMTEPAQDFDITEDMTVRITAETQDDFGLSRLLLHYKLDETKGFLPPQENYTSADISFLLAPGNLTQTIFYTWVLEKLNLQPEDVMSFYLEVFDNDNISGPKSAKSAVRKLRFPSLAEIFAEASKGQDLAIQKAEDILEKSEDIQKELEDIHRDLLKDKKLDWKDKEKIKQLTEKQENLQKQVQEMKENLQALTQKLDENNVLSKETLEKYQELQKLLSEINNKEFQDLMRKLQEAMQKNFDPKMLKDAMKQFKFDQEAFKQSVERTLELLKRIKAEMMFDQLRKETEDLKRRQEQINQESQKTKTDEEQQALAREQERLEKALNDLQKKAELLKETVKEINPKYATKELEKASEQIKSGKTQSKMQQSRNAIQNKRANQKQERDNQQAVKDDLDSLSHQVSRAQKEFRDQQDEQIMAAMRKIIYDLLEISKGQEVVLQDSRLLSYLSDDFRLRAQEQADLQAGMERVADNLVALSNQTFFVNSALGKVFGQALASMQESVRQLAERNALGATERQQMAMGSVNEAIRMLMESMNQIQQGQSGTGMQQLMQQLQQMAGKQGQINDGTLPLMPGQGQDGNEGMLSQEQQAQLGRMMAEQQALKEAMEALQAQAQGQQNFQGQLGQMAKDMEEVIKDMKNQNVNRKTIERQQKILQRMLDATRSIHEKDQSEKRKGETAKSYKTKSPGELPDNLTDRRNKLRQDLMRAMQEGFSKDYQELIRKYFEALEKMDANKQK